MPTERQLNIILESELEFKTFKDEPMSKEITANLPPMTLPQTTIDQIKADAVAHVEKTRGMQGRVETYEAGATEWAGKAQPVVDMLETTISILSAYIEPALFNQEISNEQRILINTRNEIERTITKYKKVTNG